MKMFRFYEIRYLSYGGKVIKLFVAKKSHSIHKRQYYNKIIKLICMLHKMICYVETTRYF